jgi:hypothetical protein
VGVFWAEVDSIQQCLKITIKIDGLDFKGAPQDVSLTVVLKCFPRADEGRLLWDIEPEIGIQEGFWNKLLAQVLVGVVHTLSLGFWTLFDEEQNKVKQAVSTLGGVSGSKALLYDQLYRRRNDFRDLASVHP